jgi:hypothetical protein
MGINAGGIFSDFRLHFCGVASWGVFKSLGYFACGPVVLFHTQEIGIKSEKPTSTKADRNSAIFASRVPGPCLLSGEPRT